MQPFNSQCGAWRLLIVGAESFISGAWGRAGKAIPKVPEWGWEVFRAVALLSFVVISQTNTVNDEACRDMQLWSRHRAVAAGPHSQSTDSMTTATADTQTSLN